MIYDGAIDDHSTSDASDIPNSKNYVQEALLRDGRKAGAGVGHAAVWMFGEIRRRVALTMV